MSTSPHSRCIVVIGGGITGLSAAVRLRELDPSVEVVLLEAADRLGGVLHSVRRDGFLIERGADNFITNVPWALDLCKSLGLESHLITTDAARRRAFVVHRGQLHAVPAGFLLMVPERIGPLLFSGLLSLRGKLRVLGEYFIAPRAGDEDETLASFAVRRLGREAFERLVQPLIGGIYTADPEKLSLAATMPRFLEMERRYGGLLRARAHSQAANRAAADRAASDQTSGGARYSLFVTPDAGLSTLIDTLAARLPAGAIRLSTAAQSLQRTQADRWQIVLSCAAGEGHSLDCDGVVVALPAPAASRLLAGAAPELSGELAAIPYAGAVVVSLGYRRDQIRHALDGIGFVVPAAEKRSILAASFSSLKFAGRAPHDHVLLRVFVGGACQAELTQLADEPLQEMVERELAELLGVSGPPVVVDIARWPASMAQYHLGHLERVARIEALAAAQPGLALAGNAYRGVGISYCVRSGQAAAERLLGAAQSAADSASA